MAWAAAADLAGDGVPCFASLHASRGYEGRHGRGQACNVHPEAGFRGSLGLPGKLQRHVCHGIGCTQAGCKHRVHPPYTVDSLQCQSFAKCPPGRAVMMAALWHRGSTCSSWITHAPSQQDITLQARYPCDLYHGAPFNALASSWKVFDDDHGPVSAMKHMNALIFTWCV